MTTENPSLPVAPDSALLDILWIDESHRIIKANKLARENAGKNGITLEGLEHSVFDPDFPREYLELLFSGKENALYYSRPKCHRDALCNQCEDLLTTQDIDGRRLVMRCGKNIVAVRSGLKEGNYPCDCTRELHQAQEAATAAKNVRSEFIANMNHEIRTPMNAIIGYAEMLAGSNLEPREKRFAEVIYRSGITLVTILNDIMDLSKIESGRLKIVKTAVRLSDLLEETIEIFQDQVSGKQLDLLWRIEKNVPEVVMIDGLRLKQVLNNLLSNAVKFTSKGSITLFVAAESIDNAARLTDLVLTVEDTGSGVLPGDQDLLNKILQPQGGTFPVEYSGRGFGLPLCGRLVSMMGGAISMQSEYGKGTRMVVTLSNVTTSSSEPETGIDAPVGTSIPTGRIKLLVVDDMDLIKDVFTDYFSSNDTVKVLTASTGTDALRIAAEEKPTIIFMDLNLGGKDGKAVTRELRADPAIENIPVVAMTGHILEEQDYKPLFDDFLQKPFRFETLRSIVTKYSEEREAVDTDGTAARTDNDNDEFALDVLWTAELNELLRSARSSGSLSAASALGRKLKEAGRSESVVIAESLGEALINSAGEHDIMGVEQILTKLHGYTVSKADE